MFNGLNDDEIVAVKNLFEYAVKLNKGEQLYKNGMLGIITSGCATIKRHNDVGDAITIRTISNGDLFGSASVFGNWKDGMSSITANTTCKILYISEEKFCNVLKQYPQISINYIEYLSDRIRFLNRKLDAFTAKSTEQRLYEFLLSQCNSDSVVNLNFGIAELARRLNVGRTSIYRDIASLESKGLLERYGHSFIIKG